MEEKILASAINTYKEGLMTMQNNESNMINLRKRIAILICMVLLISTNITGVNAADNSSSNSLIIGKKVIFIRFNPQGIHKWITADMDSLNIVFKNLSKQTKIDYTYRTGSGLKMLEGLDKYDIVVINTEGGVSKDDGPSIGIGDTDNSIDKKTKAAYEALKKKHYMAVSPEQKIWLVTPAYFKDKVKFKDNSIVMLLACNTAGKNTLDTRLVDAIFNSNKVIGASVYYNDIGTQAASDTDSAINLLAQGNSLAATYSKIQGDKLLGAKLITGINTAKLQGKEVYMQGSDTIFKEGIKRSAIYLEIVPSGMMEGTISNKVKTAFKLDTAPWHQIQTTLCSLKFKEYADKYKLNYKFKSGHGIQMFDNLKDYGVVIISAYGNQLEKKGIVVWLGEYQSAELDSKYSKYLKEGSIVNIDGHYAITSKYIQNYVKFNQSGIVLNMFNSSAGMAAKENSEFAQAEINAGAIEALGILGQCDMMQNDFAASEFIAQLVLNRNLLGATNCVIKGYYAQNKYKYIKNMRVLPTEDSLKNVYMAK